MFKGQFGGLELHGDHLDLSYREPERWPALTPSGSIRSYTFDLGDEESGPSLQLGLITPVAGEQLDWKHSIDPVHHHGSDQFRVVAGGEWVLANRAMPVGTASFQEAGWVYQEHPGTGAGGAAWTALLMGDRRGTMSTLRFAKDQDTIFDAGAEFGQPVADIAYPHPAGNKGLAAIVTSIGPCRRGYLYIAPGEGGGQVVSGLLGDAEAGPVVHIFEAGPRAVVVPPCEIDTEVVLIVTQGSCDADGARYAAGDIRVQSAGASLAVSAGAEGVHLVMIVADRRAAIRSGARARWMDAVPGLVAGLEVHPGGTWRAVTA